MLIGELSRRTSIPSSAIRFYEAEGLVPRPERLSGRRNFDGRALSHLMVVQLAKDAGFTLAEIRQLVTEFGRSRWRRLAKRKLAELRAAAERQRAMKGLLEKLLDCECPDIDFCGRAIERSRQRRAVSPGP